MRSQRPPPRVIGADCSALTSSALGVDQAAVATGKPVRPSFFTVRCMVGVMRVLCARRTLCERQESPTQVIAGGGGSQTGTLAALPEHPEGIKPGCCLKVPSWTPVWRPVGRWAGTSVKVPPSGTYLLGCRAPRRDKARVPLQVQVRALLFGGQTCELGQTFVIGRSLRSHFPHLACSFTSDLLGYAVYVRPIPQQSSPPLVQLKPQGVRRP